MSIFCHPQIHNAYVCACIRIYSVFPTPSPKMNSLCHLHDLGKINLLDFAFLYKISIMC